MALTSLQVCSDWLQSTTHEDESAGGGGGMDSASSLSGAGQGACSRPMMERRLKPPQDQAQKCPRCDSAHTKFCYYNNYSLSQPRYFCKTCRRYWTQGGTLRNIPVGGVCRRNTHKKHVSKKSSSNDFSTVPVNSNPTDLQLSSLLAAHHNILGSNNISHPNFLDGGSYNAVDFTDKKQLEASRNYYGFMGQNNMDGPSFAGLCSPFGMMGLEHGNNVNVGGSSSSGSGFVESYRRLMLPYDAVAQEEHQNADVKPSLMGLDQWQEQGYSDKDSFAGYLNNGSWTGMMNAYGSSAANHLV